jgi:hypothetical protein
MYYVVVKGFGVNTGTFSVGITAISEDPCDGGAHRLGCIAALYDCSPPLYQIH